MKNNVTRQKKAYKNENGSLFFRFDFRFLTLCLTVVTQKAPSFV
ncbi:hypothetical protein JN11_01963 [Mucilaginibacter frigoritolerans]|uniref:Uncharacterized protein n=1 Tax=Mucilaginibacter frigoritolerans TaxID=652788 RepID=A0A562U5T9_9SPHI|nr:hypothetical protein JN11_01963 [Mucilaginibacter frigoritolerans]